MYNSILWVRFPGIVEAGADQLRKMFMCSGKRADIKLFGGGVAFREHFPWCQTDDIVEATWDHRGKKVGSILSR